MELQALKSHIKKLIYLEDSGEPLISCYLNLDGPKTDILKSFCQRLEWLLATVDKEQEDNALDAAAKIVATVERDLKGDAVGVAIFSRAGENPLLQVMEFQVPVQEWLVIDSVPNIYPLVEMKDKYHRFVILITNKDSARILEINMGELTEQILQEKPEVRQRIGREWAREHYQNHKKDRSDRFMKEKIKILEQLMREGGYNHLVLAGSSERTARVRNLLPNHLKEKLVDELTINPKKGLNETIVESIHSFTEHEKQESHDLLELLKRNLRKQGLAVVGVDPTLEALSRNQVDVLVISDQFQNTGENASKHPTVMLRSHLCEEMVKIAELQKLQIEIVEEDDWLIKLGGVGALLRYK